MTREEGEQGNEELQDDIQGILWWMFRADNGPRYQVKVVAPEMNISPDTLNKYIRGILPFPAYHIHTLWNTTHDRTLFEWIISRSESVQIAFRISTVHPIENIQTNLNHIAIGFGKLVDDYTHDIADGLLSMDEQGELCTTLNDIIGHAERTKKIVLRGKS